MVHFESFPEPDKRFFTTPPTNTTILIVGGGPAGLISSLLFARRNIKSVIVERHPLRRGQPKAHAINPRTLEILRQAGLDTAALRKVGSSVEDAGMVRFVSVLGGSELGSIIYERQDEAVKNLTPEPLFNVPQPTFETFLQEAVLSTGLVTIHRRWHWHQIKFRPDNKPISYVVNLDSQEELEISSEYVIGADGTESAVRKKMEGVSWDGIPGQSSARKYYVSIHARGNIRPAMKERDRYAVLYFCLHPKHRNAILCYDLESSWVYARVIDPDVDPIESFTIEKCRELLDGSLGFKVDYDVVSANMWYTDPRIATSYSSSNFRIFLVGDSAHTFPPQGGLGINTGVVDAHNLCWKLAAVINGKVASPERLLATYTSERRPVAMANALQSFINQSRQTNVLEPAVAAAIGGISVDDNEAIEKRFQDPEVTKKIQEAIDLNRPHFDSLSLQLGYVYGKGDGTKLLENCSDFKPTGESGARLPHYWVSKEHSILDLVAPDKFTVLVGPVTSINVAVCVVDSIEHPLLKLNIDELRAPAEWMDLVGIKGTEGLLIRPDQHILGKVSSVKDIEDLIRVNM